MSGKIFLVTGANKGIGREITRQLVAKGHTVYLGTRNADQGQKAAKELGDKVRFVQIDLTNPESHKKAAEQIKSSAGHLDGLINNAAIAAAHAHSTAATLDDLRKTFETNYFGTVMVTQAMLPLLRAGKTKVIVNLSSGLGSITQHSDPTWPYYGVNALAYNSSKSALNMFTVLLAKELQPEGFRVNSVNPGWIATDMGGPNAPGKVEDGASMAVQCATEGSDGPTGMFRTTGGIIPW